MAGISNRGVAATGLIGGIGGAGGGGVGCGEANDGDGVIGCDAEDENDEADCADDDENDEADCADDDASLRPPSSIISSVNPQAAVIISRASRHISPDWPESAYKTPATFPRTINGTAAIDFGVTLPSRSSSTLDSLYSSGDDIREDCVRTTSRITLSVLSGTIKFRSPPVMESTNP